MKCPACQDPAAPGARFCVSCGKALAQHCPHCGAEAPPGARFCAQCGQPLRPQASGPPAAEPTAPAEPAAPAALRSSPPPEAERKIATALASEIVASPPFTSGDDQEALHHLLDRFVSAARREIERYGGTLREVRGSGFVALFGAPVTQEDHAWRAAMAALALRPLLREVESRGRQLDLRMGLASGVVVIGGRGDLAVGSLLGTASGLCAATSSGIVLSASTHRYLASQARVEPVPSRPGAGPEDAALVKLIELGDAFPGGRELTGTPLVGRDREVAVLRDLLERATAGRGQVVGITGEAGAGKSRLVAELRQATPPQVARWWRGRCLSYAAGTPYFSWSDLLRDGLGLRSGDSGDTVATALGGRLAALGERGVAELVPYLDRLLGAGRSPTSGPEGSQAMRSRTFEAIEGLVHTVAREGPLVIEIEDLHWIDETSEALLSQLVESLAAAPLLVLVTYRSGYRVPWIDLSYATQITLSPLGDSESRRLLAALTTGEALPGPLVEHLLARAEGNPLYLEQLGQSAAEGREEGEEAVPETLQEVIAARIDRLDGDTKRLLQTVSVLDGEFPTELLAGLWEDDAHPIGPLLDQLVRREILVEIPSFTGSIHRFRHVLTQEVVYLSLLAERRRELHRRAARTVESLWEGRLEEVYDRLVYHWPRAGEYEQAVRYSMLFAERAVRSYAHGEAVKALQQALVYAENLPDEARDRWSVELALAIAESLLPLARLPETREVLESHRQRLDRVGDPRLTARFYFWLAHTHSYLGEPQAAAATAELGIAAAQEAEDEAVEGQLRYVLGRDAFWSGDFTDGQKESLRAVVLLERSGEPWWQGQAYWVAAFHSFVLGDREAAFRSLERARVVGETLGDPRLDISWSAGYFHASLGQAAEAIELCRRGVEQARDPLNASVARGFLGYAWLAAGDPERAREALERAVAELADSGMRQLLAWFRAFLAEVYLAQGRLSEAEAVAQQALETAASAGFALGTAWSERTLGRIAVAGGRSADAKRTLRGALADFERRGVRLEAARTRLDLADLPSFGGDEAGGAAAREQALAELDALGVARASRGAGGAVGEPELDLAAGGYDAPATGVGEPD